MCLAWTPGVPTLGVCPAHSAQGTRPQLLLLTSLATSMAKGGADWMATPPVSNVLWGGLWASFTGHCGCAPVRKDLKDVDSPSRQCALPAHAVLFVIVVGCIVVPFSAEVRSCAPLLSCFTSSTSSLPGGWQRHFVCHTLSPQRTSHVKNAGISAWGLHLASSRLLEIFRELFGCYGRAIWEVDGLREVPGPLAPHRLRPQLLLALNAAPPCWAPPLAQGSQ